MSFWVVLFSLALITALPAGAQTFPGKIGVGLGGPGREAYELVNLGKLHRAWQAPNLGATLTAAELDASGNPLRDACTVLFDARPVAEWVNEIDDPDVYRLDLSGVYKISFNGKATIILTSADGEITLSNQLYDSAANTTTADVTIPSGSRGLLIIDFINTQRTETSALNTGIANLRVTRPGYAHSSTELFTTDFMNVISAADFSTLRFMDFTHTNNKEKTYPATIAWSERELVSDSTWEGNPLKLGGIPWEVVVALGNATNKDIWINVPVSASTDYVTKLAQLIRYGSDGVNPYTSAQSNPVWAPLNSGLKVYLESSNEVWNGLFSQSTYNQQQGQALIGGRRDEYEVKNHARRTMELVNIFSSVFGASAIKSQILPIFAWQSGCCLHEYDWGMGYIRDNYGTPSNYIQALGGTIYFNDDGAGTTATPEQILTAMQADSDNGVANRSTLSGKADTWGVQYYAYEGGPDTGGGSTTNVANRIRAERHSGMEAVFERNARENFFNIGGDLYMQFVLTSGYNRYGCWGLTDDGKNPDRNFKFKAIRDLIGTSTGDTTPPANPTGLTATAVSASQIDLDWANNTESDLAGYNVYRSTTSGSGYAKVNGALVSASAYSDTGLTSSTTYYYVVRAVDTSNNESGNSNQANATTQSGGGGCTASATHVSSIVVTTVSAGSGNKRGQAQVTVLDNCGNPVANATVTGDFTGSIVESGRSGVTNSSGVATIQTNGTKKGSVSVTFCVTGISHASLSYNASANVETCDSGS